MMEQSGKKHYCANRRIIYEQTMFRNVIRNDTVNYRERDS